MSDLADRHRRIAAVVEPLEKRGVETSVYERGTDEGDLYLTLDLRIPPALDPTDDGDTGLGIEHLEARCEQLREERDRLRGEIGRLEEELVTVQSEFRAVGEERDEARERLDEVVRRAAALEDRIAELEDQIDGGVSDGEGDPAADSEDAPQGTQDEPGGTQDEPDGTQDKRDGTQDKRDGTQDEPDGVRDGLTDGQRQTLEALRELGGSRASGEIADQVDATLPSVRSWLSKLVQTGRIRAVPDPTDGRRKLYSAVESDDGSGSADGTVYIASKGGSPSQVFHVRTDCPQLKKSADFVEKDRSVVPHHRPCGNCVPDGLEEGLVAIAKGSPTTTYHKREDCPKLGSATEVAVQPRETVPNYNPCGDCVPSDSEESDSDDAAPPTAAEICARNDLGRDEVVAALERATAIYHVQRDLALSRDETEALLRDLGVFEDLSGGGRLDPDRARAVARKGVPVAKQFESDGGKNYA